MMCINDFSQLRRGRLIAPTADVSANPHQAMYTVL